jgi:hypothetical protein
MRAAGVDLEGDIRELDTADLPAFGEHRADESRKSAGLAAKDPRQYLGLAVVGALVDKDASGALGFPPTGRPPIARPGRSSDRRG